MGAFWSPRCSPRRCRTAFELHRWSLDHPEVKDEQIVSPWIIVGLPRTGTSVLSMLLGLDPLARPLLQWEAARPIPPATLEEAAEDPRIARTAKDLDGLMKLNPPLKAMHPFGATLAEECVSLFMYDVRTMALETQAHVPSYARWLEQADMTPAYAQHRLALQTLQSRQPTERWILKTPNHLWHLDAMLAAYPDARVIWTHRDPGPVVTSLASLANAGQRPLTSRSDPRPTAEEWKRKCGFALRSAMAFDQAANDGWCQHLHYDALIADPVEAVCQLYRSFGKRSGRCTSGACAAFWPTGRPTPSVATATTRPTSAGPLRDWPRSSPTTPSATGLRRHRLPRRPASFGRPTQVSCRPECLGKAAQTCAWRVASVQPETGTCSTCSGVFLEQASERDPVSTDRGVWP